jgi:hypothetical protein
MLWSEVIFLEGYSALYIFVSHTFTYTIHIYIHTQSTILPHIFLPLNPVERMSQIDTTNL